MSEVEIHGGDVENIRPDMSHPGGKFSEASWQVALASVSDGVITTDANGRVTFLNSAAETLTGWTQRAAENLPLEQVFQIVTERQEPPSKIR